MLVQMIELVRILSKANSSPLDSCRNQARSRLERRRPGRVLTNRGQLWRLCGHAEGG